MNINTIEQVPLNKLRLSPRNARKTATRDVEDLAASIATPEIGLLQNLTATQAEDGQYEVVAGGRRLEALQLLASRNALPVALQAGIPCRIVAADDALEASAAENTVRERMHPADEFEAFKAMVDNGKPIAEVAAHFGVAEIVVKQRLKLANVAPALLDLYRKDGIELDQLQALAITDDHDAQLKTWQNADRWNRDAADLRGMLTRSAVSARSGIAQFVGVDAYVAAGGELTRDLFGNPDDAWLSNRTLLDTLALDKLEAIAQAHRDEGWSWAEAHLAMDYAKLQEYPELPSHDIEESFASLEDEARHKVIEARLDEIQAMDEDAFDADETVQEEFRRLDSELDAISDRMVELWPDSAKAAAGVLVYLSHSGLQVDCGRLRPGQSISHAGAIAGKPKPSKAEKAAKPKKPELSAAILTTLSAHRNARARAIIAVHPMLALCLLVDRLLASSRANHGGASSCIGIGQTPSGGLPTPDGTQISKRLTEALKLAESNAMQGVPRKDVLPWLMKQPLPKLLDIIAALVAERFHAVTDKPQGHAMVALIDNLIDEPGFIDLADHWTPTTDDFLGRIHGDLVAEAVAEAVGKDAVAQLKGLKKAERTATAAKLLAGTGWLPKPLRSPAYVLRGAGATPPSKTVPKKTTKNAAAKKAPAKAKKQLAAKKPAKKATKKAAPKKKAAKA